MDRHHRKYKSREMKVKTCSDRFETFSHSNRLGVRSILSGNTTSFEPVLAEKEYFWCLARFRPGAPGALALTKFSEIDKKKYGSNDRKLSGMCAIVIRFGQK